ncbi:hypothetical protein BCR36DRAFT_54405 [Piromyces finnis]|uniref:Coth-domain-containing protein n=1 Tax=Piromyces finnis TaxID=1754191 RepID=A0A1Y1V9U2_9FUNG|nr:hypothetical protein BCR36DRAFT_54405 [Piromyces finnis]|eukprot:ORX50662.1 hypothetical protein BCR36DRAFT_54405 [Piromyces finnis]
MKFSTILSVALIALTSKVSANVVKDDFLKDTNRADLFTLTDNNIPDVYIDMEKDEFDRLIYSASVNGFNLNPDMIPPPPPGAPGNENNEFPGGPGGPGGPPPPGPDGPDGPGGPPGGGMSLVNPGTKEEQNVKIEDASLRLELNGENYIIPSLSISVGGEHSRNTQKVSFNIKCNKGKLLGRKVLRLRSNDGDATLMRSKLTCDLFNRLGLPSISANYVRLHLNGDFSGLYVIMDNYKSSWIKQYFDDKEVKNLYQCKPMFSDLSADSYLNCVNSDDERADDTEELKEFLATINAAKSREEIEDIMDVDAFIQGWILEYLLGSGDHMLINGKNYFLYKQPNGKWTVLYYDFDSMFGVEVDKYTFKIETAPELPFTKWYFLRPIVDVLVKNDEASFLKNLQYIVDKAFNPDVLFPHIDSLKKWIEPYIAEDRTEVDGVLPGRINTYGYTYGYDYDDFIKNTEYTMVDKAYGLKEWIQRRYNFICSYYDITCPGFEKPVTTDIEDEETEPVEVTTTADFEDVTSTPSSDNDDSNSEVEVDVDVDVNEEEDSAEDSN